MYDMQTWEKQEVKFVEWDELFEKWINGVKYSS